MYTKICIVHFVFWINYEGNIYNVLSNFIKEYKVWMSYNKCCTQKAKLFFCREALETWIRELGRNTIQSEKV